MKRIKVMAVLCVLCLLSVLVAGCARGSDSGAGNPGSASASVSNEAKPATLRLVMYGDAGTRNVDFFENEFKTKLKDEANIEMKIDLLPWGATDQIATMLASGEKFGFMASITNEVFPTWASNGYFAEIDESMVQKIAPNYVEARMGKGFECARFKGKAVLIPAGGLVYSGAQDNFAVRNDLLNAVGWDYTDIHSYEDLMEAIAAVKEKYPNLAVVNDIYFLYNALNSTYAKDGAILKDGSPTSLTAINEADDSSTVINWFESEYFANMCRILEDWFDRGYITVEYLTEYGSSGGPAMQWETGNCLLAWGDPADLYDHELVSVEGADVRYLKINDHDQILVKDYDWSWAVSAADQENVENWMRFFDWMYASEENYLFCMYGVEGKDWKYAEDGSIERLTQESFFYEWMCGTMLYKEFSDKYDADEVQAYLDFDNNAIYSKKTGFVFDVTPVQTENALLTAIIQEKVQPIGFGLGSYDEDFPEVLEELKAAGLDKYIEEYQKQFSEFMAGK